ncbi:DUF6614 family protein [Vibrio navarrensis]|uniref:DUF6614 family protein n=1 Tax=Vibrio navarrensis TaxID=29495 RepID=UPI00338E019B
MKTYNVFYSVKQGVSSEQVSKLTDEFIAQLRTHELIESAASSRIINKGNFPEMPDFHLAVNFKDQAQMDASFHTIRLSLMTTYPHADLMRSVADFKVTFSESLSDLPVA